MTRKTTFNFLSRKAGFRFAQLISLSFCIFFLLLAFTTGDSKSEYILPPQASSVCTSDINLDGSMDIIVGHIYSQLINWTGITMMINDGNGYLMQDTFYLNGQHRTVLVDKLNNNDNPDLVTQYYDGTTSKVGILYDFFESQNNLISFNLTNYADYISTGDVNGDGHIDIIVASNNGKFWGVLYNDGAGNFSGLEYYYVDYYPTDLHCGDLNNDSRDDIILASQQLEIYYSTDTGFVYHPIGDGEDQVALADFDMDGDLDIVGNAGFGVTSITFYENTGNENFIIHELPSFLPNLGNLNIADLNNDGLADIIMETVNLYIFYNQSNFTLSEPSIIALDNSSSYHDFCFSDLDGNGFKDIAYTLLMGVYLPNLRILFNDGEGNFLEDPITNVEIPKSNNQIPIRCFPNPFTTETTITYSVENSSITELVIYRMDGSHIITLKQEIHSQGEYKSIWNGTDKKVKEVEPGTYLLTLKVIGNAIQTAKLIKH